MSLIFPPILPHSFPSVGYLPSSRVLSRQQLLRAPCRGPRLPAPDSRPPPHTPANIHVCLWLPESPLGDARGHQGTPGDARGRQGKA